MSLIEKESVEISIYPFRVPAASSHSCVLKNRVAKGVERDDARVITAHVIIIFLMPIWMPGALVNEPWVGGGGMMYLTIEATRSVQDIVA